MKKIRHKVLSLIGFILTISLILQNLYLPVYADSMFIDVTSKEYYSSAVLEMAEKGYLKGYGDGNFGPLDNITIAESLVALFRLAHIEIDKQSKPQYWYSEILNMAIKMNLVSKNVNPYQLATRLDIANFISKLYKLDLYEDGENIIFEDIQNSLVNTLYGLEIYQGVLYEGKMFFLPYASITRGDFALVMSRIDAKLKSPYIGFLAFGDYEVNVNPYSFEDFKKILTYLAESNELSITIPYTSNISNISYYLKIRENVIDAFEVIFATYPEYLSFTPSINISRKINGYMSGEITLTLSNANFTDEEVIEMRKEFDSACDDMIYEMESYGLINSNMTSREKAEIFFQYVAMHCEYDIGYSSKSYTGYGAAVEGKAVCQGYVALFNNLCRKEHIEVKGITGKLKSNNISHMWSSFFDAEKEEWVYCDVTFGDPISNSNEEIYFDMSYFDVRLEDLLKDRIIDDFLE